jgi:hypothetical protein
MSIQQTPRADAGFIERLVPHRLQIAVGVIVFGLVVLKAIPITAYVLYRRDESVPLATVYWGGLLSVFVWVVGLIFALLFYNRKVDAQREADRLRIMLLILAGGAGALTALFGLALPFSTQQFRDVFAGGLEQWRKHLGMLLNVTAALLGGLFLIFAGMQLARTWERSHGSMRRLLYGYNAVFSSVLVIVILLLVNVLSYAPVKPFSLFAQTSDWTQSRIYSLSDSSKNFLHEMKEPVKVYVLQRSNSRIAMETETLLNNCRAVNPRISWEMLSPDINQQEVIELIRKYQLPDPLGLLVLYGTEPNVSHEFIKNSDLFALPSQGMMRGEQAPSDRFIFKGEGALMKALRYLAEGKSRATVYFTQGHGELELSERNPFQAARGEWSASKLRAELERRNYQVRPLKIDPDFKQFPEDADVVVVAGPTQKWPDNGVQALRDYLQGTGRKKPGRAVVCVGIVEEGGSMAAIGLEPVLAEHNVRLGNERLLAVQSFISPPSPTAILAATNPASNNPVARAFFQEGRSPTKFVLQDARSVQAGPANPNMPSRWTTETLLVAFEDQFVVGEANLKASPRDVIRDLRGKPEELRKRLLPPPVPLGVSVSESSSNMPQDMAHAGLNRGGEPRLIVIGDARWIADPIFDTRFGIDHGDLFASGLSWLRGQSDIGSGPEDTDKERVAYQPAIAPGSGLRVLFLPGFLLILAVVTMGLGVWVVRRR